MGEIRRIDMAVDAELGDEIAAAIEEGAYPDVRAVVDAALRRWREDRVVDRIGVDRLRALWEEGIASGDPVDGNFVLDDVKRRGRERLAAERKA